MPRNITITAEYFRQYRLKLGFGNQADVKNFSVAKDITPTINQDYFVWEIMKLPPEFKKLNLG